MSDAPSQPAARFVIRPWSAADLTSVLRLTMLVREAPSWNYEDFRSLSGAYPSGSAEASSEIEVPDAVLLRHAWVAESTFETEAATGAKSTPGSATDHDKQLLGLVVVQCLHVGGSQSEEVEAELESILVHPDARRLSIGSQLLEAAIGWCRAQRASILRLEVRNSNLPAVSLYQRFGFSISGHRPGYYRNPEEDAVLMELSIPSDLRPPKLRP